ncbi:MAG TPA: outer membrane lipoprotein carrier protein LolA [Methylomirabilota bacterium]|nr:outer membrane lipoprotein carrier protein LolA [Methylomirabilota bacterium]
MKIYQFIFKERISIFECCSVRQNSCGAASDSSPQRKLWATIGRRVSPEWGDRKFSFVALQLGHRAMMIPRLAPWATFFRRSTAKIRIVFLTLGILTVRLIFAADTNSVLNNWFAAQTKVQTWSADFVQTRTFRALTQPLTAKGKIYFSAPDDFQWELGQPAQTIALRHDDEMFVIYPLLKRAERYPMGASAPRQLRDTMSLLQAGLPRSRKEFESQFQIRSLMETNGNWQLTLQPKSPGARQMLPEMQMALATNDFSLASTTLIFADGSTMRNDFTNAVLNPPLDKNLFEWKPPDDFKITEPMR